MLFFYNGSTGAAATGRIGDDGRFEPLKDLSGFGAWTHIISEGRNLLFYNSETRAAGTGRIKEDGTFENLEGVIPDFDMWTHIVSDAHDEVFVGPAVVKGTLRVESHNFRPGRVEALVFKITPGGSFTDGSAAGEGGGIVDVAQIQCNNVLVRDDIQLLNEDCAEEFDVAPDATPDLASGTVVVLDDKGGVRSSDRAYDTRVAGVVSGAGGYAPGIVLGRQHGNRNRTAVALLGKVGCQVDATSGSVGVGDLLTTSDVPGVAMRAGDPARAFGAVLGKALQPLERGRAMIPILVTLQ